MVPKYPANGSSINHGACDYRTRVYYIQPAVGRKKQTYTASDFLDTEQFLVGVDLINSAIGRLFGHLRRR